MSTKVKVYFINLLTYTGQDLPNAKWPQKHKLSLAN